MRYNPASGNAEGFLQYHFPAEGGSALKYQPLPGITNAGFAGCVEVTLEYNLQELTATAAFDGGAVLTVNNVSQKLRSGDLAGLNQLVGANLFAGVLASAQGGSKKDNVWCFKSFFFAQAFIEAPAAEACPDGSLPPCTAPPPVDFEAQTDTCNTPGFTNPQACGTKSKPESWSFDLTRTALPLEGGLQQSPTDVELAGGRAYVTTVLGRLLILPQTHDGGFLLSKCSGAGSWSSPQAYASATRFCYQVCVLLPRLHGRLRRRRHVTPTLSSKVALGGVVTYPEGGTAPVLVLTRPNLTLTNYRASPWSRASRNGTARTWGRCRWAWRWTRAPTRRPRTCSSRTPPTRRTVRASPPRTSAEALTEPLIPNLRRVLRRHQLRLCQPVLAQAAAGRGGGVGAGTSGAQATTATNVGGAGGRGGPDVPRLTRICFNTAPLVSRRTSSPGSRGRSRITL